MPAKTGASHCVASFVALIVGSVLSTFVSDLLPPLRDLSLFAVDTVQYVTGVTVPMDEHLVGTVVVMSILSFTWGVVFHVKRHA